jgi:hypothetical protein
MRARERRKEMNVIGAIRSCNIKLEKSAVIIDAIDLEFRKADGKEGSLTLATADSFGASAREDDGLDAIVVYLDRNDLKVNSVAKTVA